jgi:hypothetical protein
VSPIPTLQQVFFVLVVLGFSVDLIRDVGIVCCDARILGFEDDRAAFREALVPTATCAIGNTCRGYAL